MWAGSCRWAGLEAGRSWLEGGMEPGCWMERKFKGRSQLSRARREAGSPSAEGGRLRAVSRLLA